MEAEDASGISVKLSVLHPGRYSLHAENRTEVKVGFKGSSVLSLNNVALMMCGLISVIP
jgi:hypothetical protein